jgi:lysyl-tRNA synthetase class 2
MQADTNAAESSLTSKLDALAQRAVLLCRLRAFFEERGFIEVETPLLSDEVIPEPHIEPIRADNGQFLQASPELHMKWLLSAGAKAIFQVTRSFRAGERGQLHNPEFTIVEWYRAGDDMHAGIALLDELTQTLLGTPPADRTMYAAAFKRTLGLCPHSASICQLAEAAAQAGIAVPANMERGARDEWLNLLLATRVEPQLGHDRPEILFHYPASQASLSQVVPVAAGYDVAERFELYYRGIELANGFHELAEAAELRRRFQDGNVTRVADGRSALPLPEQFLNAMRSLPNCTGCALGFDRLVMLALGAQSIDEVMTFPSLPSAMR